MAKKSRGEERGDRAEGASKMRVAVIGAGRWGENLVRNFYQLEVLHAICDVSEVRLREVSNSYPGICTVQHIEEVLSDKRIDAVAIATPANTHFELAKQALGAGKDVFVEKPLSLHYQEGKELVLLAEQTRRILMVGHLLEFHPAIQELKSLTQRGVLGKLNYLYSNRLNLGRVRKDENSLWSFAPHDIAVILSLVEQLPFEVAATGGAFLQPGVADVTLMTMRFPSGVRSHIFVSWLHPYKEQRLVVIGSEQMAAFNDLEPVDKLMLYDEHFDWVDGDPVSSPKAGTSVPLENAEPLRVECRQFLDCLASRREPLTSGASALRVLRVLEAAQHSLQMNGVPVSIEVATALAGR
jgi:UDP-2-acetamido-3-amino-2,3-dideoxy-glucuronate N-acetyltransferase